MTSKPVAQLLIDLGVARSHSRPHVSNDNPYSEANFKTLKYCPAFPGRFGSIERRAGLAHFRLHDLRHFMATTTMAAGVPSLHRRAPRQARIAATLPVPPIPLSAYGPVRRGARGMAR